ncbi:MAG: GNAT family N-acetyltransferase [Anaerolineae bacterium]|nr:GNAT family N-acetyltransferase [Anaerolineae bacterium]
MEASLSYRFMRSGEESTVCTLVTRVFNEFVAPEYSDDGVEEFLKYVEPGSLLERSQQNHFVLVALLLEEIVGMIEVRDYGHISLLFVDKRFQRIGIGRELLRKSLEICFSHKPGLLQVSVNSSPYAMEVYRRLGFRQKGPRQTVKGICFDPMVLELSGP